MYVYKSQFCTWEMLSESLSGQSFIKVPSSLLTFHKEFAVEYANNCQNDLYIFGFSMARYNYVNITYILDNWFFLSNDKHNGN